MRAAISAKIIFLDIVNEISYVDTRDVWREKFLYQHSPTITAPNSKFLEHESVPWIYMYLKLICLGCNTDFAKSFVKIPMPKEFKNCGMPSQFNQ